MCSYVPLHVAKDIKCSAEMLFVGVTQRVSGSVTAGQVTLRAFVKGILASMAKKQGAIA